MSDDVAAAVAMATAAAVNPAQIVTLDNFQYQYPVGAKTKHDSSCELVGLISYNYLIFTLAQASEITVFDSFSDLFTTPICAYLLVLPRYCYALSLS